MTGNVIFAAVSVFCIAYGVLLIVKNEAAARIFNRMPGSPRTAQPRMIRVLGVLFVIFATVALVECTVAGPLPFNG